MIRILIADDHLVVREGLAQVLATTGDIEVVAKAASGGEALQVIREAALDVALLDVTMPGLDGLETLKQIKIEFPKLPVLLFSMHAEEHYALRCIKAGAAGYLNKNCERSELLAAIRQVAAGKTYITPEVGACLVNDLDATAKGVPPHQLLSDREFEVLQFIGQGLTPGEMAERMNLSPKTISTYRERVLSKLGLDSNAALMRYALTHHIVT